MWVLVSLPPNREAIGSMWVFRVKYNADGSLQKHKARLVTQGYAQKHGSDFIETYSPVVKPTSIRLLLSIAVSKSWQAPREWYHKLASGLREIGFAATKSDVSVFVKNVDGLQTYVLVYVDDIIVTGESSALVTDVIAKLNKKFALKDMGDLHHFLGIQKYVGEVLKKAGMVGCASCHTHLPSTVKISALGGSSFYDPKLYRSIIGSLQYLTITRPEICYSVNKLSQFVQAPLDCHWRMVKRVLRYLSGTTSYGLHIKQDSSMSVTAYSDSN
ncbi:uncharacterized protein LOC107627538 [Arachis ipaensis]|uniref:uncharacterized protein LOC107627538 n=1 Tax=Arachis ipaensis TaxID=130454 RepID=UPI0007AF8460|nr:uncharacterized protein LOC107627538 [Arachis ipaensis]